MIDVIRLAPWRWSFLVSLCLVAEAGSRRPRLVCLVSAAGGTSLAVPGRRPQKSPWNSSPGCAKANAWNWPGAGSVQLAFLQQGVRETWTGPATVLITSRRRPEPRRRRPAGHGKTAHRGPTQPASGSSILSQGGEQATAQIMTREVKLPEDKPLSDEDKARLADVEQAVTQMRQGAAPGDVTPDIVLSGGTHPPRPAPAHERTPRTTARDLPQQYHPGPLG